MVNLSLNGNLDIADIEFAQQGKLYILLNIKGVLS